MKKFYGEYIYIAVLAGCLFLYAPLAFLFPYGSSLSSHIFYLTVPHLFIASTASIIYCLSNAQRINPQCNVFRICSIAMAIIAVSGLIFDSPLHAIIESAAFFSVPLAINILRQKFKNSRNLLLYIIVSSWVLSAFYCLIWPGNTKIGFAGNQNWLAATILPGYFFVIILLKEKFCPKVFALLAVLTGVISIYILYFTDARAIIPALGACLAFFCLKKLPKKHNIILFSIVPLLLAGLLFTKKDYLQRTYNADVRGPLTIDTAKMILDSPLLGHGPGHFQRDFPVFASDALKQRSVYSPVVEHPHNEWLHMASTSGIAVAVLWLFLLWYCCRSKHEANLTFLQMAVICLFIMGLADKPLLISASAIIFLIGSGLCLPQMKETANSFNFTKICQLAALTVFLFSCFRLYQVIPAQYSFWQGKKLYTQLTKTGKKELLQPLFELYSSSTESDPYLLEPHYHKASMLAQQSTNLDLIQSSLEDVILLAPNYADLNYQISHYYQRQAQLYPESKQESLKEAEEYIKKNLSFSPWSIKRNRQLVRFYCQNGQYTKALDALTQLKNIARQKLQIRYTYNDRRDLEASLISWKENVKKGQVNLYILADSMKANIQESYLFPKLLPNNQNSNSYNDNDRRFWQEKIIMSENYSQHQITSFNALERQIQKIAINNSMPLQSPLQTWSNQKASSLSLAHFINDICRYNKWDSCLHKTDKGIQLIIFAKNEIKSIDCETKVIQTLTAAELNKISKVQLLLEPERLTLRNHLISDVLSSNGEVELCQSATELSLQLKAKLPEKTIVEPYLLKTTTLAGPQ